MRFSWLKGSCNLLSLRNLNKCVKGRKCYGYTHNGILNYITNFGNCTNIRECCLLHGNTCKNIIQIYVKEQNITHIYLYNFHTAISTEVEKSICLIVICLCVYAFDMTSFYFIFLSFKNNSNSIFCNHIYKYLNI